MAKAGTNPSRSLMILGSFSQPCARKDLFPHKMSTPGIGSMKLPLDSSSSSTGMNETKHTLEFLKPREKC